ncbi:probable serine/threonine-protein kinase SIS8 isoform X2 [Lactuca sativa]|uniref:probable serine/threonine-protein kinase SIS8 isoform X2 n=1 Tax=Lactuca sativa TaxID=4236 RepID=UPI0022AFDC7B|nr:probable serine/threonine-protein kinase SIS8 isoform X2 [Lactuca sativa]
MKNLLKKLHMMPNQTSDVDSDGCNSSSKGNNQRLIDVPSSIESLPHEHNKPLSGISGWLNSVTNRRSPSPSPSPPSSSNVKKEDKNEGFDSMSSEALDAAMEAVRTGDSGSGNSRDPEVEEEYQIQLALELSAREDPEAVQIEAVKQISLGSFPAENNTPAEVLSYRYWNYSALSYDDKILDGFYDLCETSTTRALSSKMPSLVDLQGTPVSDNVTWEAIVVNKAVDAKLLQLEQTALEVTAKSASESLTVQRLAVLVSNFMGGPVGDPDKMLRAWQNFSYKLKATLRSMVLPLGLLKIGMARHRALLFKVLADSVGIPCRLVKGKQYTGSSDVAMNLIKIGDGREYIVDLMADPGTLIPSDTAHTDHDESSLTSSPWSHDDDSSRLTSRSGLTNSSEEGSDFGTRERERERSDDGAIQPKPKKSLPLRPSHHSHARSPSWTEGVSSPAVRKMKVKDVSQYMIDAAKENPQLAQKLHDVLLESGVVAPANLFTEVYDQQEDTLVTRPPPPPPPPPQDDQNKRDPKKGQKCKLPILPKVPAAATAAAAAAVVASSMVVAATNRNIELPVAAAATVTAAAVVAAVDKKCQAAASGVVERDGNGQFGNLQMGENEGERVSDRSAGNDSTKSEVSLDDVADCEIAWEDITLGERIGLGSYGEVYRGDWHGTEVAVKKFLDQEVTVESLEEFKSEVGIMKRVRHPNVVLFMGAITRAPHLSIVTEFLPRGSLYRLIHRPNNQLDIRRRLRIALDAARGMNYLHNCTPVIVHRDLKSPNLLVDKNWVVKVCDFGLSRMKYSTFLSSRSTAGTV